MSEINTELCFGCRYHFNAEDPEGNTPTCLLLHEYEHQKGNGANRIIDGRSTTVPLEPERLKSLLERILAIANDGGCNQPEALQEQLTVTELLR
ncbi:hypothetical protein JW978_03800 [Candidatus Dojkabacteria bacterium]|nr:hypothetical protein [Candidatus Dojkabacteria bacterium]